MRTFFSHFSHITSWWCQFVFHRTDLNFLVKRSLSYKIFLINFADGLSSMESSYIWSASSFLSIDIEILSFYLMIFVCFLFTLKSNSFLIDLSLSENTGFYVDLFLWSRIEIDFDCIISFFWIFTSLFISVQIIRIIELVSYLRIELSWFFDLFGSEYPIWHLWECFFALDGHEVVIKESSSFFLFFGFMFLQVLDTYGFVSLNDSSSFFHILTSDMCLFSLLSLSVFKLRESLLIKLNSSDFLSFWFYFRLFLLSSFCD